MEARADPRSMGRACGGADRRGTPREVQLTDALEKDRDDSPRVVSFPCNVERFCGKRLPQRKICGQAHHGIAKRSLVRLVHNKTAAVLAAISRNNRVGRGVHQDWDTARKVFSDLRWKRSLHYVTHVRF